MNTLEEFDFYLVGAICFNEYFFSDLEESINRLYYSFNEQFGKDLIRNRIELHNENPQLFAKNVKHLNDKVISYPWDQKKTNKTDLIGIIYVFDEIVIEINNSIIYNQLNDTEYLSNSLLKFARASFDKYTIGTRYIAAIKKWFTFVFEKKIDGSKKLLGLFLNTKLIDLIDILGNKINNVEKWISTDERCASVNSLDYLFYKLPDDYNINRLLEIEYLQMIIFNQDDKIIYGSNLSKIRHKAKLSIGDYGMKDIQIDALETLKKTGNNNAKFLLLRYYQDG